MVFEFEFGIMYRDGRRKRIKKRLEEITDAEIEGKVSLGTASGLDLPHCVFIGWQCCRGFLEEVRFYRFCGKDESVRDFYHPTAVEFYK